MADTHEMRTCSECHTEFRVKVTSRRLTCSDPCRYRRKNALKRANRKTETRFCEMCGDAYVTTPASLRRTCGKPECQALLKKVRDASRVRAGMEVRTCAMCPETYEASPGSSRKTCGRPACVKAWAREQLRRRQRAAMRPRQGMAVCF